MTQQINRAYEIATIYRQRKILTVIGGIHASILPDEAAKYVDIVLVGEAETVWPKFYRDLLKNTFCKIYRSKHVFGLKDSKKPRYDLLKDYDYPLITIQTTRGCPHKCSFCAASRVFGPKYRRKMNVQIIEELKYISKMFPGKLILFADDNAFVNVGKSIELLHQIEKLDIRFIAQVDIAVAENEDLLFSLSRAGCQWVVIGFESTNMNSLRDLDDGNWKYKHATSYEVSIKKIHEYGIGVYGTFMVGLDSDDYTVFQNTARFIVDNNLYGANITIPTPLPGTKLREKMLKDGRVLNLGWEYYTLWDVVISFPNFKKSEIEEGLLELYKNVNCYSLANRRIVHLKQLAKNKKKILANK